MTRTPSRIASHSPQLGEHTDAVLKNLGCSAEEIIDWRERGVI